MKNKGYRKQKIAVGREKRRMQKFLESRPEIQFNLMEYIREKYEKDKKAKI